MEDQASKINRDLKRKSELQDRVRVRQHKKKPRIVSLVKQEEKASVKEEEKSPVKTPKPKRIVRARTPRQDALKAELLLYNSEIDVLKTLLAGPNPLTKHRAKLVECVRKKDKCTVELRRLQSLVKASRKHRLQQNTLLKTQKTNN